MSQQRLTAAAVEKAAKKALKRHVGEEFKLSKVRAAVLKKLQKSDPGVQEQQVADLLRQLVSNSGEFELNGKRVVFKGTTGEQAAAMPSAAQLSTPPTQQQQEQEQPRKKKKKHHQPQPQEVEQQQEQPRKKKKHKQQQQQQERQQQQQQQQQQQRHELKAKREREEGEDGAVRAGGAGAGGGDAAQRPSKKQRKGGQGDAPGRPPHKQDEGGSVEQRQQKRRGATQRDDVDVLAGHLAAAAAGSEQGPAGSEQGPSGAAVAAALAAAAACSPSNPRAPQRAAPSASEAGGSRAAGARARLQQMVHQLGKQPQQPQQNGCLQLPGTARVTSLRAAGGAGDDRAPAAAAAAAAPSPAPVKLAASGGSGSSWRADYNRPDVKHGRFSDEEKAAIAQSVRDFAEENGLPSGPGECGWIFDRKAAALKKGVATAIAAPLPQRTRKAVWQYLRATYSPVEVQGKWSPQEDARLLSLYTELGPKWREIGLRLGRLDRACRDRARDLNYGQGKETGRWTQEELEQLGALVGAYKEAARAGGGGAPRTLSTNLVPADAAQPRERAVMQLEDIDWTWVSSQMRGRTPKQAAEKYYTKLAPGMIEAGEWARGEDRVMASALRRALDAGARGEWDVEWASLVEGRSAEQCKRRWHLICKHLPAEVRGDFQAAVHTASERLRRKSDGGAASSKGGRAPPEQQQQQRQREEELRRRDDRGSDTPSGSEGDEGSEGGNSGSEGGGGSSGSEGSGGGHTASSPPARKGGRRAPPQQQQRQQRQQPDPFDLPEPGESDDSEEGE